MRAFFLPLSIIGMLAAVFSCTSAKHADPDQFLFSSDSFQIGSVHFENIHNQGEIVYIKYDTSRQAYSLRSNESQHFTVVNSTDLHVLVNLDLDTIVDFDVSDFYKKGDSLLLCGKNSELALFNFDDSSTTVFDVEEAFCNQVQRTFSFYNFPLYLENGQAYLHPSTFAYPNFYNNFKQQQQFFSLPVEMKFDLSTAVGTCFGKFPASYLSSENKFYQWSPFRARLDACSFYCYPHVDSIYRYCDALGTNKSVGCRSALFNGKMIDVDKSRYNDYTYLGDYILQNDQIAKIIPDEYRDLIYVVCISGIEPDPEMRFRRSDLAFTIMVFNSNLEFLREVYFPLGNWLYEFNFVNPDGLFLQRSNTIGDTTLVYDGFDLGKEGNLNFASPKEIINKEENVPLGRFIRDSLRISADIDTVIVISSLGCKGCLESKLAENNQTGFLARYAIITDSKTAKIHTVRKIIENKNQVYIDSSDRINRYRIIGDFLTLIVLSGDSVVVADKDFGF